MESPLTLHDFVLNLISDPAARSAFEIDPEGALRDAGLSDITAADVHEVIPLVVDYAPIDGLAGLDDLGELPPAGLDTDPAAAIHQLQAVTDKLAVGGHHPSADLNVTAAGAITIDAAGLTATPLGPFDLGLGLHGTAAGDLSASTDPAGTLDLDGEGGIDATGLVGTTGVVGTTGTPDTAGLIETPDDVLDTTLDGVLGTVDVAANTVTGGLLPDPPDVTDPVGGLLPDAPDLTHPVGALGGLPAVGDSVHHIGGVLPSGAGDGGVGGHDGILDRPAGTDLGGEHGVTGAVGATATAVTDIVF